MSTMAGVHRVCQHPFLQVFLRRRNRVGKRIQIHMLQGARGRAEGMKSSQTHIQQGSPLVIEPLEVPAYTVGTSFT